MKVSMKMLALLLTLLLAGAMIAAPVLAQDAGAPATATPPAAASAPVEDELGLEEADAPEVDAAETDAAEADAAEADAAEADAAEADATEAAAQAVAGPVAGGQAASRGPAPNPAVADPSLLPVYRQFGELAGITALMDDFMLGLLADARMQPFFAEVDQAKVKKHLVEQVCVILGGPCVYSGRDMLEAHAGMQINRSNFNALVEVLQVAMDKRGIPFRAQNQLLARLAPMHRQIETR